jgi:hypothetical protein
MRTLTLAAALALAGCAATYELQLMPHDSGRIYFGTMHDPGNRAEGPITITIDNRTFTGTWVQATSDSTTAWVSGGVGWWGPRGAVGGGFVSMDNPQGAMSMALLTAPDGSGLRCNLRMSGSRGDGMCRDDQNRFFDVQIRPASAAPATTPQ